MNKLLKFPQQKFLYNIATSRLSPNFKDTLGTRFGTLYQKTEGIMKDNGTNEMTALEAKTLATSSEAHNAAMALNAILQQIQKEAAAGKLSLMWHGLMNETMTVKLKDLGYELFPHDNNAYVVISWHLTAEERPPAGK